MSQTLDTTSINQKLLVARENMSAPTWQDAVRSEAKLSFATTGLPTTRNESYKYSNIEKVLQKNFAEFHIPLAASLDPEQIRQLQANFDHYSIIMVNGCFAPALSVLPASAFVTIEDLGELSEKSQTTAERLFGNVAGYHQDALTNLNTVGFQNGIFIDVDKNQVIDKPVCIYHITDSTEPKPLVQPRILIAAGKSSAFTLVETYVNKSSAASLTNAVTEIAVSENAQVRLYKIQDFSDEAFHVDTLHVHQQANSRFTAATISFNAAFIRNNLNIIVDGSGCEANMYGLYMPSKKMHVDNHTVVDHKKPHSESNELYKGIIDDKATGVFNGKIFVRQDAQKTNAFQSNANILLSDTATINTKPQLEIWADDVKCSHGATTGQLDEESLFYLRTRGLDAKTARAMLLNAFATDVLSQISIVELREALQDKIQHRLSKTY